MGLFSGSGHDGCLASCSYLGRSCGLIVRKDKTNERFSSLQKLDFPNQWFLNMF
jgi:hypothetical protein